MKTLLLIIVMLTCMHAFSQDTTYFDKRWKKTTKDNAEFYRLQSKEGSLIKITDYYTSDTLQMIGYATSVDPTQKNGTIEKNGDFRYYRKNGTLDYQGCYKSNKHFGIWQYYYEDGSLYYSENYDKKGRMTGNFTVYYPDGKIRRTDIYVKDEFQSGKCFSHSGNDTVWYPFMVMPQYAGGDEARQLFLQQHIVYPEIAAENGNQGTVFVSFVVDAEGTVEEVEILQGVCESLDNEALRVVNLMPRWKPGTHDGKPIRVLFNMPIYFKLKR